MARFLFIHNNFPAQFVHLSRHLTERGHEVHGFGLRNKQAAVVASLGAVHWHTYALPAALPQPSALPHLQDLQVKLIRAEAALPELMALKRSGLMPDMVVAHPGWGEAIFAKDLWPQAVHVHYLEFFYGMTGRDVGFDPEFDHLPEPDPLKRARRLRMKNVNGLMALDSMDWGLSPTQWQRSTYPTAYQNRIDAVFDGIDTQTLSPKPDAELRLGSGPLLKAGDPIVTFVNRNFEPYRGYHIFMRALPQILRDHPGARVVLVGGDGVSYGAAAPEGQSWRQIFLDEVKGQLDPARVHFVGPVPRTVLTTLMQISACHVYLTNPFVLSLSCVEALSMCVPIVASDTAPVREFLRHEDNALLVDFFKPQALAPAVLKTLREPQMAAHLGERARAQAVAQYDLNAVCLPQQRQLLERLLNQSL